MVNVTRFHFSLFKYHTCQVTPFKIIFASLRGEILRIDRTATDFRLLFQE